ncbi:quinone-reactive Ni/Fe-hydrogenase large subunit [Lebetimonas natsushimae]|uniref:Quinone-reactive Ni/Fe-hydrogenase large subunit n=1 Tax=Lebetimonas natsushimae TaxID=1936991 RepID=A0A292YEK8_9BACT|nr:nickel-dependent hydrogenase large subunit [Lebetimonas natsushimae]GAX87534.1 quinone-reactive Ni/Fe-hydrogenase large subunit [Lebetimonas natsushimae]
MAKRVVIDPITRIEGHLRVEVVLDENNVIKDAYSSATLWRGIEVILKGRDPRDAGFMTQRICGVCTYSHYKAGIMAVENALGIEPPLNAKLTRSLMNMALFFHDHMVHFYQLHGLDWVDIISALKADPKKASEEAFKYVPKGYNPIATGEDELREVQKRVAKFAEKGDLGPFKNAYFGHKTMKFTPEQNLIALSHYLKTLEIQRIAAQAMAIFGGKNPHPQSLTVGGVTCTMDLQDPSRLGEYLQKFQILADYANRAYYADLAMAAEAFRNEPSVTQKTNLGNFLTYREHQVGANKWLFDACGYIKNHDLSKFYEIDESKIEEDVTHSWYKDTGFRHPYDGETVPEYTGYVDGKSIDGKGNEVDTKLANPNGKYSWVKSPRYDREPMEVGPLACMVVNYAKGNEKVRKVVDEFLAQTGLPAEALFTVLGRTAARMLQTKVIADYGLEAFNNLVENLKSDKSTVAPYKIDPNKEYKGRYIGDVPRGMLSHWCRIKNGKIENWQAVVPSTWNAGPADGNGKKGAYEANLIGMKLADPTKPLEVIRSIHSYDPCIACAVHVMDVKGKKLGEFKVDPLYGAC